MSAPTPQIYNSAAGNLVEVGKGGRMSVKSIIIPIGGKFQVKDNGSNVLFEISNATGVSPYQVHGGFVFGRPDGPVFLGCDVAGLVLLGVNIEM